MVSPRKGRSFVVKWTGVAKFWILVGKGLPHTHVADVGQVLLHLGADLDAAILKDECLHAIAGEVDIQVRRIAVLELGRAVLLLVFNDLVTELAPRGQIHPGGVGDEELGGSGSLPLMEGPIRLLGGGDLPLDKSIHGHEGRQLLGDELEASAVENRRVSRHGLGEGEIGGIQGLRGPWLVEEDVDGGEGWADEALTGHVSGHM